ncbi:carbohydrate ABC transporter permease [Ruminococcaceae bacterium OttesenSCG-928-D13]|nr:carbohydrate ABC transporter permease [Ruminococcaceae bacterium OttesenSCG-928-D13]
MGDKVKKYNPIWDILGIAAVFLIFIVPFLFMLFNALKSRPEANKLSLSLPETFEWGNFWEVIQTDKFAVLRGFWNSGLITLFSVLGLILVCSMAGYVLQRRRGRLTGAVNAVVLIGLMVPPAILPTIWVLQGIGIFKTIFGMVMVEIALQIPFTIMLYRGFMSSIPADLEEAAIIDGCGRWRLFFRIIFPLLKPVTATITILNAVTIFNDFTNPLYFLPGSENVTVQLTLYRFMGRFSSSFNLLFADVIIITIPMLILFIIFNKKIVAGMVAGAVKG